MSLLRREKRTARRPRAGFGSSSMLSWGRFFSPPISTVRMKTGRGAAARAIRS
jgi:hypothetical protein